MTNQMTLACLDLEGVLIPEIWIAVAHQTGIEALKLTTRDIADYEVLMKKRLAHLAEHRLTLQDLQAVVAQMEPLAGAFDFLQWLQQRCEVIILSDTFREFAQPFIAKLQNPTVFCHSLIVDEQGNIRDYQLRQQDQKRQAVKAFKNLNFHVVAVGDSYNDLSMLQEAHQGIFFRPTPKIVKECPKFPVTQTYEELKQQLGQTEGFRI